METKKERCSGFHMIFEKDSNPTITNIDIHDNTYHGPVYIGAGKEDLEEGMEEQKNEEDLEPAEPAAPKPSNFALLITRESQREHVLDVLHDVMRGKKGKAAALVMLCAREAGLIVDLPSWSVATEEFGDIGCQSNYSKYTQFAFTDEEKQAILHLIIA